MKIDIHAPWSVNDGLRDFILKKTEKFSKFHSRITHVDVFLKKGEQPAPNDNLTEIRVRIPGKKELFAHSDAESFEKGMTAAAEKMKRQLVKKVEQMNAKRSH